ATSGSTKTITCIGRSGNARRKITFTYTPDGNAGFPWRAVYCAWPNAIPQTRTWSGTAWSAAADTATLTQQQFWTVVRRCRTRTELIAAFDTLGGDLEVTTLSNTTWAPSQVFTTSMNTDSERPFYAAYEHTSGDGLIVYKGGATSTLT